MAVHVLTLMAWADDEPLKSEQVAESVNTNAVVIRRMLCELAESKLVVSQTGSMGGSRLARQPEEITLLEIYQAVESRGVRACGASKVSLATTLRRTSHRLSAEDRSPYIPLHARLRDPRALSRLFRATGPCHSPKLVARPRG